MASITNVVLSMDEDGLSMFMGVLRKGVRVEGHVGLSIGGFLREEIGMDAEYIESRIQTIFLNGRPVDDVEAAVIGDGDALALSASMPGLAGATLRKGGHFAGLRSTISYREEGSAKRSGKGVVTIKLFNLIAKELAPLFFERGFIMDGEDFSGVLHSHHETLSAGLRSVEIDGQAEDMEKLEITDWDPKEVFLRVRMNESSVGHRRGNV
ncbi:MAG: hypothetical protein JW932_12075 [Deltaproteobacteria bacterium]|nr:hypothetical protein [Deltaproteobacteria bacterium]